MVKKLLLSLAALLAVGGMAWAQSLPTPPAPGVPGPNMGGTPGPGMGRAGFDFGFDVVPDLSTAARNSAGRFGSDADDFIDPNSFDPQMGTYIFLGVNNDPRLDLGFAMSLGGIYLAVYYGGAFADAMGWGGYANHPASDPERLTRRAAWDNQLALMVGVLNMGFRIDARMAGLTGVRNVDGSVLDGRHDQARETWMNAGPSLALTWGANFGDLSPWARVGYRFANVHTHAIEDEDWGYVRRFSHDGGLGVSAGADFALNEVSSVGAALHFGTRFAWYESETGTFPVGDTREELSNRVGGMTGFGLDLHYARTVDLGLVAIGVRPILGAAFTNVSNDWDGSITWGQPWDSFLTVDGNVELGARLRVGERFAFYTGVRMALFDWTRWAQFGGDDDHPALNHAWRFTGLRVADPGLGMTVTPRENVDIGLGFSGVLGGALGRFDLTISARLGGGNGNGTAAPAPAPAPVAAPADEGGITE